MKIGLCEVVIHELGAAELDELLCGLIVGADSSVGGGAGVTSIVLLGTTLVVEEEAAMQALSPLIAPGIARWDDESSHWWQLPLSG